MTYHGGVEDGMSAAGAKILLILHDLSLPDEDKLDMIEQYCRGWVKNVILPPVISGDRTNSGPS